MPSAQTQSITNREAEQIARANGSSATPVVFVHGLWLLPTSWERWVDLFERNGFLRTTVVPFEQAVEDFIRALQSTSSLSRVTLGERTDAFAADVRGLFARLGITRIALPVAAALVWGRPLRP